MANDVSPGYIKGQELDYVAITADVTVSGSSGAQTTIITGSTWYTPGDLVVWIEFFTCQLVGGSQALIIEAWDNGSSLKRLIQTFDTSGNAHPAFGRYRYTPAAGNHQIVIKGWVNGGTSGTVSAVAGTYVPAYLRVAVA